MRYYPFVPFFAMCESFCCHLCSEWDMFSFFCSASWISLACSGLSRTLVRCNLLCIARQLENANLPRSWILTRDSRGRPLGNPSCPSVGRSLAPDHRAIIMQGQTSIHCLNLDPALLRHCSSSFIYVVLHWLNPIACVPAAWWSRPASSSIHVLPGNVSLPWCTNTLWFCLAMRSLCLEVGIQLA